MVTIIPPAQHSNETASPAVSDGGVVRGALGLALVAVLGFGLVYPLAGVGLGQAMFPHEANGSLIKQGDLVKGSALVAQPFAAEGYFHSRPSAGDHQPMDAGGSNEARTNPELRERLGAERTQVARREGVMPENVPSDLITQSGGGFDPHISPQAAQIQIERVARSRGLDTEKVALLVADYTEARQFGLLGQPRVHVLGLNLALDAMTMHTDAQNVVEAGLGED